MPQLLTSEIGEKWIQPELKLILPTCKECKNYNTTPWTYEGDCSVSKRIVNRSNEACPTFQTKTETCRDCAYLDAGVPANSQYQFCLLKGDYLNRDNLNGCNQFKPIVPYKAPLKKRRLKGDGTGSIQLHYCKAKSGKSYEQFYYHYEIWENGVKQAKGSKYITSKKLDLIREMEASKQPVTLILKELGLTV